MNAYLESSRAYRHRRIVGPIVDRDDTAVKQLLATVTQCLDDIPWERDERTPSVPLEHISPGNREEVTPKREMGSLGRSTRVSSELSSSSFPGSPKRPALAALLNTPKHGRSFTLYRRQTIVTQQDSSQMVADSQGDRSGSPVSCRTTMRESDTLQQPVLPSSPSVPPRTPQSTTAFPLSPYPERLSSPSGSALEFIRRFQEIGRSNRDTASMPLPMRPRCSLI
ncbi:hypothetical protein COCC4DRAFT_58627 [Bipolaris maydis ATCC 48331]|uniref:Uncharacterized protein n=2 Tax=Cochliobolus heterostrophus TaxID=5016 RepID=M2U5Z9_COCH5|nr:uncharacterized protein COCC4DRAFT_58627 [Bipolaris maydis ATCC 48331]EMD93969.1 hypothetical protein COCHEDRAFT_1027929 [Bipolaris maydis C5]ENI07729.1 hypothetical protein COCC4DRAFT_58627 [Bipolaris maydis ATCC 48331]KAJ6209426.1 hypothetical protein PSV09DRAFT_1027929 [Bipolaris maydis]